MELEEAIKICEDFIDENKSRPIILHKAIETVLKAQENSIPKKKIEHDLEVCQNVYKKEMKPYQTEYGLDVTYLSKKEKQELVNKRNCLITQMETYKQLLEEK